MEKYFDLLLDLLDIPQNKNHFQILEIIEKNKNKQIYFYHQYGFIFQWYQDLLNKQISPEDFLQFWDIDSKIKIDLKKLDSISLLRSDFDLDKNSIYIFDSLAEWIIAEQGNVFYC